MTVQWFRSRTVQKGKGLTLGMAQKRLEEIRIKKTSSYHKAYIEGRISVCASEHKRYGRAQTEYDLMEMYPMDSPLATSVCGNCESKFEDPGGQQYLCFSCRNE